MVTVATVSKPRIRPSSFVDSSMVKSRSPVTLVLRRVSTGAVFSVSPGWKVISVISSVLKSSWMALPGLGESRTVTLWSGLVPPTRTTLTSIRSFSPMV